MINKEDFKITKDELKRRFHLDFDLRAWKILKDIKKKSLEETGKKKSYRDIIHDAIYAYNPQFEGVTKAE